MRGIPDALTEGGILVGGAGDPGHTISEVRRQDHCLCEGIQQAQALALRPYLAFSSESKASQLIFWEKNSSLPNTSITLSCDVRESTQRDARA